MPPPTISTTSALAGALFGFAVAGASALILHRQMKERRRADAEANRAAVARAGAGAVAPGAAAPGAEQWRGKVALVTGASAGIGAELCRRLAAQGMHVAGCARSFDRLVALQKEIETAGGSFLPIKCDLFRESDIVTMVNTVVKRLGSIDVLVNNAGMGKFAPLCEQSTEEWRSMLELNVVALCVATREAMADMKRRGEPGHIVHVSSMSGHRIVGTGRSGFYAATKYAVRALTESLRRECRDLGVPVRVTQISPGLVRTEFAEAAMGKREAADKMYADNPYLTASDICDAVLFSINSPQGMEVHDVLIRPTEQAT